MPTASSPQREAILSLDEHARGFPSVTHNFGRLALQVPPKPGVAKRLATRMGLVADSILTPREANGGDKGDVPWFRAETPPEHRVPLVRQHSLRWMRNLDVQQERESLTQLNPMKQQAASWPCDRDVGSKEGTASMGSLKVLAKS